MSNTNHAHIPRIVFCGAVDDGKSTVMGRLLAETSSVTADELDFALRLSPNETLDYSLLVDGLESEREQGITIDVAHRHLTLSNSQRVILADSPGHEQYTRNMAVASASAEVAVIVVDAVRGVREQTVRHGTISALMGVKTLIFAINKLDAVTDPHNELTSLSDILTAKMIEIFQSLGIDRQPQILMLGISGLRGDNVTEESLVIPSGDAPTLKIALEEALSGSAETPHSPLRLPVQAVLRNKTLRKYVGRLAQGTVQAGDKVHIWPSLVESTIASVHSEGNTGLVPGTALTITLEEERDVKRGDIILSAAELDRPISRAHLANLIWLSTTPLNPQQSYLLNIGPTEIPARIERTLFTINPVNGKQIQQESFPANTIGRVEITLDRPMLLDSYAQSRESGGFILVDRQTSETVAVGLAIHPLTRISDVSKHQFSISRKDRESANGFKSRVLWLTGLPGSGKSTIADELEKKLFTLGIRSYVLDGDTVRQTLSEDLGFSPADRHENVRRVARVAQLMIDAGILTIVALVSPFEKDRQIAREIFADEDFLEIYVDTPIDICMKRDPKGLYRRALSEGKDQMTGVGQTYEPPTNPELVLDGTNPLEKNIALVLDVLFSDPLAEPQ